MSALGSLSPLSVALGSGTSHVEDVYRTLRAAVGTSASPVDGLDDLWRQARAVGIASGQLALDRAAFQALPEAATDHLAAYERNLAIAFTPGRTEQERRERVTAAWVREIVSTPRGIELSLQNISANYSLVPTDHDQTDSFQHGRAYPARGEEATRGTTNYPNYSTAFRVNAAYSVPVGETVIPAAHLTDGRQLLNDSLPAWVDFVISQEGDSGAGFYADGGPDGTSVADLTAIY
jgi:hypothetical protein